MYYNTIWTSNCNRFDVILFEKTYRVRRRYWSKVRNEWGLPLEVSRHRKESRAVEAAEKLAAKDREGVKP